MVNVTQGNMTGEATSFVSMRVTTPSSSSTSAFGETTLAAVPEERTIAGIPVRLLWVPYVSLGLILVVLMLVSFIRYHRKHGHKYQQRRLELWKKFNMENLMDQLQEGVETVGGIARGPPNGGLNISPSTSSAQEPPPPDGRKKRRRRPIFFTSNLNGSMVDIRCSNSSQTFRSNSTAAEAAAEFTAMYPPQFQPTAGTSKGKSRTKMVGLMPDQTPPMLPLLPGPSPSQYKFKSSPVIWTLTRPRNLRGLTRTPPSFFSSPMDIQADEIEAEDDEVFLLSQTPL